MKDLGTTLFILRLIKLILEIALLALVGQGIAWAMIRGIGQDPSTNVFYRTLQTVVSPFIWVLRRITPKFVIDRHLPWALLGLLAAGYVVTLFAVANACISHGVTVAECQQIR